MRVEAAVTNKEWSFTANVERQGCQADQKSGEGGQEDWKGKESRRQQSHP